MVRLYPWPSPVELQSYYPENYWFNPGEDSADRAAETWRRFALRDHIQFVQQSLETLESDGLVLDVGCGGGLFLRELKLPQSRVVGLDFSCDAAKVAWKTNGVPALCGALPRAPFKPGSFSLISMFHVLEHLYDPLAYVKAAHRLLKPGGRLIIQVPNANCWQFRLLGEAWNGLDVPRHLIDFKEQDLRNLLEHCGFDVLRTNHFCLRDNPAGMATSIAPALDPMARRIRGTDGSGFAKLIKDGLHFLLLVACIPFALVEAAFAAGSTIMVEAQKREQDPEELEEAAELEEDELTSDEESEEDELELQDEKDAG